MKYYILGCDSRPIGYSGELCNSTYDLNGACKNCGTGANLVGRLITRGITKVRSSFFSTVCSDFLISEGLFKFLLSKGIHIKNLKKVLDSKKNELPFYHLYCKISFPRSLPSSEGLIIRDQCPVCRRNGYFSDVKTGDAARNIPVKVKPLRLKYKGISNEFLVSSELFNTWEHIGISNLKTEGNRIIRYARPMLIVSERIMSALKEYRVNNAVFDEVLIS